MHVNEIGRRNLTKRTFPCYQSDMATPKPAQTTTDRAQDSIASALRTLEAEGSGIDALKAALRDGLGRSLADAVDTIRGAQGRVIVTGMGKSGHVARKIAVDFGIDRHACVFRPPERASHGDLGMIANNDVILALSWSGETAELKSITGLFAALWHQAHRDDRPIADSALAESRRCGPCVAAGARGLPAQSRADDSHRSCSLPLAMRWRSRFLKAMVYRGRLRPPSPRRQARHAAQDRARYHAHRRDDAAYATRHPHVRRHS
jgi:hypothetical protein